MDRDWLPGLLRIFDARRSRRGVTGLLSGILAAPLTLVEDTTARRRKKKKRRKQSPPPPTCTDGTVNCHGVCVDLQSDEAHCGTCQNACAANEVCQAGVCLIRGVCPAALANPSFCSAIACNNGGINLCQCAETTEGNAICAENDTFCQVPIPCQSSGDCSDGRVCVDISGCCSPPGGTKNCLRPCPNPL
jgi:hypothetical protein